MDAAKLGFGTTVHSIRNPEWVGMLVRRDLRGSETDWTVLWLDVEPFKQGTLGSLYEDELVSEWEVLA